MIVCCTSKKGVASLINGIFIIILFVISLATPWFYQDSDTTVDSLDYKCKSYILVGWDTAYCRIQEQKGDTFGTCECQDDQWNWRDDCNGDNCDEIEACYDNAGAFTGLAFLAFLVGFIHVIFSVIVSNKMWLLNFLPFLASAILLSVAVIQFPSQFPSAYKKYVGGSNVCDLQYGSDNDSPCDHFFGSADQDPTKYSWGGAGWCVALITLFFLIGQVALSGARRK